MQRTDISPGAFLILAMMLLALPLQWFFAAAFAAVLHEVFHYLALRLLGVQVNGVRIGLHGAVMEVEPMAEWKEPICALAGPVGGIGLVLLSRWMPRIAVCAAVQSFYNLLPLYPLDGGRALQCLLRLAAPQWERRIFQAIQISCLHFLTLAAVYACFRLKLGIMPLAFSALLWRKSKIIPCKQGHLRLQ